MPSVTITLPATVQATPPSAEIEVPPEVSAAISRAFCLAMLRHPSLLSRDDRKECHVEGVDAT